MDILDLAGNPLVPDDERKGLDCGPQSFLEEDLSFISKEIIEQAIETKTAIDTYSLNGNFKVMIPFIRDGKVIGFLYARTKKSLSFSFQQAKSVINFLKDTVSDVVENDMKTLSSVSDEEITPQKKTLNRVTRYLTQNFHLSTISLSEVSQIHNMSYHHLSRLFNKEFKISFSHYLNKIRIEAAVKLLRNKTLSINQISYMCGFQDAGYFCKVFKKICGVAPAEFRNRKQSPADILRRGRK